MSHGLGHKVWVIAEGYIPEGSTGSDPALVSHETACILNTGSTDANVTITVYFANRDPAEPYSVLIPARRQTSQIRRTDRSGANPSRNRLFVGSALRCARRRPTLPARLSSAIQRSIEHGGLSGYR
jgi:hypothetical protein